jgi:hypothetical protein
MPTRTVADGSQLWQEAVCSDAEHATDDSMNVQPLAPLVNRTAIPYIAF